MTHLEKSIELSCPICTMLLTEGDCQYPLICETDGCNFNMCAECSGRLLETSKEGIQEASDGNQFIISLQCPSCRGGFKVDIPDILLLRDAKMASFFEEIPDSELNAAELRKKYKFKNDDNISLLNHAIGRFQAASGTKKASEHGEEIGTTVGLQHDLQSGDPIKIHDCGTEIKESLSAGRQRKQPEAKFEVPDIISERIKYTNSMLFQGLESCMTQSEQTFVLSLLTQGSPEKLCQGAQILASIAEMNSLSQRNRTGGQQSPSMKTSDRETVSTIKSHSSETANQRREDSRKPDKMGSSAYSASSSKSRASIARTAKIRSRSNHISTLQREAAIRRKWDTKYPLPFRMPREVKLPIDSNSNDGWNRLIRFLDDEDTLSFLDYNQRYHQMTFDVRRKLVEDAFNTLHVKWGKVKRSDLSQNIGPQNIIRGLEFDAVDGRLSDLEIPWRRVIISHVDRSLERLGFRVGDVVTHIDGEPFDGNVEKLKFILSSRRSERSLHNETFPSYIQIVVNAEVGVAEALRLRSFMTRYQDER